MISSSVEHKRVFFDIVIGNRKARRIEIILYDDIVPQTCENFRRLCIGADVSEKTGISKKLSYANTVFHRVIPGFLIQGGDITLSEGNHIYLDIKYKLYIIIP